MTGSPESIRAHPNQRTAPHPSSDSWSFQSVMSQGKTPRTNPGANRNHRTDPAAARWTLFIPSTSWRNLGVRSCGDALLQDSTPYVLGRGFLSVRKVKSRVAAGGAPTAFLGR